MLLARRLLTAAGLAVATTACHVPASTPEEPAPADAARPPTWLPPYTAAQRALLEPGSDPVPVPARRTYPATGAFRHAKDRVLSDPRDAMRITRMVAEIVEQSPRIYAIANAGPDVANTVAQYGPPGGDAPDGWALAYKDPTGDILLAPAPVSGDAKREHESGLAAQKEGRDADALAHFRRAAEKSPLVPELRLAVARSLGKTAPAEAERAYRSALALDPTFSTAHEGLAALLAARGDRRGAIASLARALALHPRSKSALALARSLGAPEQPRVEPFAIFLDVDVMGAIRIASAPTTAARMYAGCRAVMRYEPELRGLIFDVPASEPYFLSATEEILCIESGIGAYVAERATAYEQGRSPTEDAQARGLLEIAHRQGLLGYVMFEVLGKHRPEHARTAPPTVFRATVAYVERYVLGVADESESDTKVALAPGPQGGPMRLAAWTDAFASQSR
jgi:tetratricopeptide (TPR) repeat protein